MNELVYKRRSGIVSWSGWPKDVVHELELLNRHQRLTFCYPSTPGALRFCSTCHEWFEPMATYARLDNVTVCDDCLIVIGRWFKAEGEAT